MTENVSELYRKSFYFRTMSLVLETCTPIDNLIQSSLESENEDLRLEWIPCSKITDIEPTQIDNIYYAIRKQRDYYYYDDNLAKKTTMMLLCLGNSKECIPTLVSEFAKIYSLPTHEYKND